MRRSCCYSKPFNISISAASLNLRISSYPFKVHSPLGRLPSSRCIRNARRIACDCALFCGGASDTALRLVRYSTKTSDYQTSKIQASIIAVPRGGVLDTFWPECDRHSERMRTNVGGQASNRHRRSPCSRDSGNDEFAFVALALRTGQPRPEQSSLRPRRLWDCATGLPLL